jgi:hypothetical protein
MRSRLIFTMVLVLFWVGLIDCQNNRKKTFKVWVEFRENQNKVMGRLRALNDSSIVVQPWKGEQLEEIRVSEIEKLKFRRKGSVGKGAAIGGGIGVATGLIMGTAAGDDTPDPDAWIDFSSTAEEKATGGAMLLGPLGAIVGSVVGSLKKRFLINGQQVKYEVAKPELIEYLAGDPEFD